METPVCKFFSQCGSCKFGDQCRFRHERPLCRFFDTPSGCFRGESCNFRHVTSTAVRNPVVENAQTKQASAATKEEEVRIELSNLSVKDLKGIARQTNTNISHCVEKSEIVGLLVKARMAALSAQAKEDEVRSELQNMSLKELKSLARQTNTNVFNHKEKEKIVDLLLPVQMAALSALERLDRQKPGTPLDIAHVGDVVEVRNANGLAKTQCRAVEVRFIELNKVKSVGPNITVLLFPSLTEGIESCECCSKDPAVVYDRDNFSRINVGHLLQALKGHPHLRHLNIRGQNVVRAETWRELDVQERRIKYLTDVMETCPRLQSLNVSDGAVGTVLSLIRFLEAVPKSSLIKIDLAHTLPLLWKADLENVVETSKGPVPQGNYVLKDVVSLLTSGQLAECSIGGYDYEAAWPCGEQFAYAFHHIAQDYAYRNDSKLCYGISLRGEQTHEDLRSLVRFFESGACYWSPERHHLFPLPFRRITFAFLLVLNRLGRVLPMEIAHLILKMVAWDYPVPTMACEELSILSGRHISMWEFLKQERLDYGILKSHVREVDQCQFNHEASMAYEDYRSKRTEEQHAQDREYLPEMGESVWEQFLIDILKSEDLNTMLSSRITVIVLPPVSFFVHLSEDRTHLVYEDDSRKNVLAMLKSSMGFTLRTFFEPRNAPIKHVRMIFKHPVHGIFMLRAQEAQMAQTEHGNLPPEANTVYLGDPNAPSLFN